MQLLTLEYACTTAIAYALIFAVLAMASVVYYGLHWGRESLNKKVVGRVRRCANCTLQMVLWCVVTD